LKIGSLTGSLSLVHSHKRVSGSFEFTNGLKGSVDGLADGGKLLLTLVAASATYGELDGTIGGAHHMLEISGTFLPAGGTEQRFLATRGGPGGKGLK
jgi:hypothetical protein